MIEGLVAAGRLPQRLRRRIMSYPLVIRLMIAMTLMPDASYGVALSRLAGLLADVAFTQDWHVPTEKGAILGQAGAGEQTLLKRLVKRRPELFAGRVICFDRNFPGHDLITAILDADWHVIARVKAGIALPPEDGPGRGWLPDGSRMTWLNAPSGRKSERLQVRAAEHNAVFPPGSRKEEVPETCTVITTPPGPRASPR